MLNTILPLQLQDFPRPISTSPINIKKHSLIPLLLFRPNPSLSTTSSAHCMRLLVLSPPSPTSFETSSSLVAPLKRSTACTCRGSVVVRLGAEGFATCVGAWCVPRGVEDRDIIAMLEESSESVAVVAFVVGGQVGVWRKGWWG